MFSVYETEGRRPSLVSALSTAYTVKSLPGAMLYIPVDSEYNTPISLKRSLSDPEIYFPSAVKHSLIVAVNGLFSRDRSTPRPIAGDACESRRGSFRKPGGKVNHVILLDCTLLFLPSPPYVFHKKY